MKALKKIISLVLAVCLLSAAAVTAFAVSNSETPINEEYKLETIETEPEATIDTQPTQPETEANVTKISVKASPSTITVDSKSTVTAKVIDRNGDTSFRSSNKSVVKITKVTGDMATVKGLKAGTVTITAENNSKTAAVKIKVIKRANNFTIKGKKVSVNAKRAASIGPKEAFTTKNEKGWVTFKKISGNKKIVVSQLGIIHFIKGLKKGKTYILKVKATDQGNYKYKSVTKKATVIIKMK